MATLKNTTIDDTGFVALPAGTGAQRPSASAGMLRYNSSRTELEFNNGSTWLSEQKNPETIPTNGLVLQIDPGIPGTYSGSGTTVTDLSGSNNNGTLPGSGVTYSTVGNGSFLFDGTSRISVPNSSSLNLSGTQQYTVLCWFNPSGGGATWHGLVSKGDAQQYACAMNSPSLYLHYESPANVATNTPANSVTLNQWQHMAIRYNGSSKSTFINTILCGYLTTTLNTASNTEDLRIGEGNTGELFIGYMGAVMIYNRALTDEEIGQIFNAQRGRYNVTAPLGSASNPADSASVIKAMNVNAPNGVYYINLPVVGTTKAYCIMDSAYNGGGWMLAMKATRGTTFNYTANYWTTANTLNPTALNLDDGDAKYDVFNYYEGADIMARWPDITTSGGSIPGVGVWTWLEKSFNRQRSTVAKISLLNFFTTAGTYLYNVTNYGGYFIQDAKTFSGWSGSVFSSQVDIRFYGFNFQNFRAGFYNFAAKVRWGFGWNENSEGLYVDPATLATGGAPGSDDVSGGIGMDSSFGDYSAGDRINCCQDNTGINRSARVEIYIR
jgi:hypothetical protein